MDLQVEIVRSLSGHSGGIISLSLTSDGLLISGGWEGHARVWDLVSGATKYVLEGHENGEFGIDWLCVASRCPTTATLFSSMKVLRCLVYPMATLSPGQLDARMSVTAMWTSRSVSGVRLRTVSTWL